MENENILISGAGIAGMALAFWLKRFGFNPTVVEISPKLREGGYAIDFMGAGFNVAEKMGILPDLEKVDMQISKLALVNQNDIEKGSLDYQKIRKLMDNRAFTLLRSDLAKVIYNNLDEGIKIEFGDTIIAIEQNDENVIVSFQNGLKRSFDLVVGADGLHSNVRNLVFGNESQFEKYFGYYTSSFTIENFPYKGRAFSMYNVPNKQVAIYSYGKQRTGAFFIFAVPKKLAYRHHDIQQQKEILRNEFKGIGWKCPELLSRIDASSDFYFDSVSQIEMDRWSKARVTLVGDACDCPSLLSGKGSTLAIVGAYILAGELRQANGKYKQAFENYESTLKPFMIKKQKSAQTFAKSFVPKTNFGIWLRNMAFKIMSFSPVARMSLNQFKDEGLKLKDYR